MGSVLRGGRKVREATGQAAGGRSGEEAQGWDMNTVCGSLSALPVWLPLLCLCVVMRRESRVLAVGSRELLPEVCKVAKTVGHCGIIIG